jgi:glutamate N-acetyltransferase/amino-acid N-acetyltransferase
MAIETPVDILATLPSDLPPVERRAAMPGGFAAGGASAGIKASGRPDLAIIRTTNGPAPAAAVFTTNLVAAAPVRRSRAHLAETEPGGGGRYGWAEAIVCTSGSANAATGPEGELDQVRVAEALAEVAGVGRPRTLLLSTGLIGVRLPLEKVEAGLRALVPAVTPTDEGLEAAAEAIRTTDSVLKAATTTVELPGADGGSVTATVSGIAKGVGMIHPRMATMLAVVVTDAAASPVALDAILRPAAARTWNQLTVDGDTSTNDTVFLLASGASGAATLTPGSAGFADLARAVEAVARDLARQQAADGEGATTLITCQVSGARDDAEARAVAREVVGSSLVKAAVHGRDPNWGRVAGAAGNARLPDAPVLEASGLPTSEARARAGAPVNLLSERLRIAITGHLVYDGPAGGPVRFDGLGARAAMNGPEILIRLDLGLDSGAGEAFGCDLTEAYVRENSEYTT